jgi:AdoMet-dependent rRNA methyltransferase SPB1
MLKKHTTRKALLDASYNRYAFADAPGSLPAWFETDESKHFRPQLPITKAEVDAIKARFRDIAARPIAKVAEARARKKRAKDKRKSKETLCK